MDDSFYLRFNAHQETLAFTLPSPEWGRRWVKVLDTAQPLLQKTDRIFETGQEVPVEARSLMVLRGVR